LIDAGFEVLKGPRRAAQTPEDDSVSRPADG
jgi:hypothetical protein